MVNIYHGNGQELQARAFCWAVCLFSKELVLLKSALAYSSTSQQCMSRKGDREGRGPVKTIEIVGKS